MGRRRLGDLLDLQDAADRGERRMTVRQWDRLQERVDTARAEAAEVYMRDHWQNQRTD